MMFLVRTGREHQDQLQRQCRGNHSPNRIRWLRGGIGVRLEGSTGYVFMGVRQATKILGKRGVQKRGLDPILAASKPKEGSGKGGGGKRVKDRCIGVGWLYFRPSCPEKKKRGGAKP